MPRQSRHTTNTTKTKKFSIKLQSKDGQIFEVDRDVAFKSGLVQTKVKALQILDPNDAHLKEPILIEKVEGKWLKKVLDWCEMHRYDKPQKLTFDHIRLTRRDNEYLNIEDHLLPELVNAAHYLQVAGVKNIAVQKIANMATGTEREQLKDVFQIDKGTDEEKEFEDLFTKLARGMT